MRDKCSMDPTSPMPEGLDYGFCTGEELNLARCAIRAAELGVPESGWCKVVSRLEVSEGAVAGTEECMKASGLWPWAAVDPEGVGAVLG